MTMESRTLTPSHSTDSLQNRARHGDARTITPNPSADNLHKSHSGRLVPAPQLKEINENGNLSVKIPVLPPGEIHGNGVQLPGFSIAVSGPHIVEADSLQQEHGRSLGQSQSSMSLLSVDSDNSAPLPIPPQRSATLNTRGVFPSFMSPQNMIAHSSMQLAVQVNSYRQQDRHSTLLYTGRPPQTLDTASPYQSLRPDASSHSVAQDHARLQKDPHNSSASRVDKTTLVRSTGNNSSVAPVAPTTRNAEHRQPIAQPQSLAADNNPVDPGAGSMRTVVDRPRPHVVDIESVVDSDFDSAQTGPNVDPKPHSSNTSGQPTWVIEEVIDFGLPFEEQGRDCEDNFACKSLSSSRPTDGPIFERCGVGSICYDEDPDLLLPNRAGGLHDQDSMC